MKILISIFLLLGCNAWAADKVQCEVTLVDGASGTVEVFGTYASELKPADAGDKFVKGIGSIIQDLKNVPTIGDMKLIVSGILGKDENFFPSTITVNYEFGDGYRTSSDNGSDNSVEKGDIMITTDCEFVQ